MSTWVDHMIIVSSALLQFAGFNSFMVSSIYKLANHSTHSLKIGILKKPLATNFKSPFKLLCLAILLSPFS